MAENNNNWEWSSNIVINVREGEELKEVYKFHNKIVKVGRKMWRDMLRGEIHDGQIKRMALGSSSTAVNDNDTALNNETFRKAITKTSTPADDSYQTTTYVASSEAVGIINEIGW